MPKGPAAAAAASGRRGRAWPMEAIRTSVRAASGSRPNRRRRSMRLLSWGSQTLSALSAKKVQQFRASSKRPPETPLKEAEKRCYAAASIAAWSSRRSCLISSRSYGVLEAELLGGREHLLPERDDQLLDLRRAHALDLAPRRRLPGTVGDSSGRTRRCRDALDDRPGASCSSSL